MFGTWWAKILFYGAILLAAVGAYFGWRSKQRAIGRANEQEEQRKANVDHLETTADVVVRADASGSKPDRAAELRDKYTRP